MSFTARTALTRHFGWLKNGPDKAQRFWSLIFRLHALLSYAESGASGLKNLRPKIEQKLWLKKKDQQL